METEELRNNNTFREPKLCDRGRAWFTEYREKYEAGALAMIKGRSNVKIYRLAIIDGHEYQLQKYPHIAPNGTFSWGCASY
jgi:hypothetical protein